MHLCLHVHLQLSSCLLLYQRAAVHVYHCIVLQRAGQYKLLTADQEKTLACEIQELVQLRQVAEELAAEMGAAPTLVQVAAKAGMTPAKYQVGRLCQMSLPVAPPSPCHHAVEVRLP